MVFLCLFLFFVKAQRYVTQLKSQINSLEAELEEQRAQRQRAFLENEQLRMDLEALRRHNADHEGLQMSFIEAESESSSVIVPVFFSLIRRCCSDAVIVVQKDLKPPSSGTIS